MQLRSWARLACAVSIVTAALTGCNLSDDKTSTNRFLNATVGVGALDLYVDDNIQASNVAAGEVSGYSDIAEGSHDFLFKRAGTDSTVLSTTMSQTTDKRYTVIAWGREGSVKLADLVEDEDAPSSGQAKIRLFNSAPDAGPLDLYITDAGTSLADVSPLTSSTASGSVSSYQQRSKGTYRLRITGAANKDDLRLDVASVTLGDKERITVVLQPSSGGVMVDALLLVQEGTVTAAKNTNARMRVVASVSSNGAVSASVGSTALSSSLTSPAIGSYVMVPAGSQAMLAQVDGATVGGSTIDVTAGADYTLLVYGAANAPELSLISEDNRLPSSTSKAKVRLVHGAEGYSTLSLTLDSVALADSVLYGTASTYYTASTNSGNALIEVASPLSNTPLYTTARSSGSTGVSIEAQGVYTVFLLGGNTTPRGVLRKER